MRTLSGPFLALVLLFGLSSCSELPPLEAAAPLQATPEQLATIPGYQSGPYAVTTSQITLQTEQGALEVRVLQAQSTTPLPLLLVSHGFASAADQYEAVLQHWASHGYIILAPNHRDSGGTFAGIWASLRLGKGGLIQSRLDDFSALMQALEEGDSQLPQMGRDIDPQAIAATGHSFGAFTAQQLGGAEAISPGGQTRISGLRPDIRRVVAISPPAEMFGWIQSASWASLQVPQLATTGTWDRDGHFVKDWRQHKLSWQSAPAGQNWLLVLEGADHYFGNLICRTQREEVPQHEALALLNATTLSFLEAAFRPNPASQALLSSKQLQDTTQGFAQLEFR